MGEQNFNTEWILDPSVGENASGNGDGEAEDQAWAWAGAGFEESGDGKDVRQWRRRWS